MADASLNEKEEDRVIIEHNLLRVSECFVYTIPPMKSSGGHRAEDWNLASPLATCSLSLIQHDSALLINFLSSRPKNDGPKGATEDFLFAQSKIKFDDNPNMQHWVENVVDSSRYFVVRISDEKKKREAHIGLGFRERNDATDFKMGLMDYQKAMNREKIAEEMTKNQYTPEKMSSDAEETPLPEVSKLSLKEGEKIHIQLPPGYEKQRSHKQTTPKKVVGKGGLLLKKPPPPAKVIEKDEAPSSNGEGKDAETPSSTDEGKEKTGDEENDDDDEWGDFESSEATTG